MYPQTISEAASLLKILYERKGDYKMAVKMLELNVNMRDSIKNSELKKAALRQAMKYEFEKEQAIRETEFKKENEIREQAAREEHMRKNMLIVFILVVLTTVVIFSIMLYKRFRLTQKQKDLIEEQKVLVEEKQGEILDSIRYAQRIQKSLLPTEKYLEKNIRKFDNK
jgi:hypothetical protein